MKALLTEGVLEKQPFVIGASAEFLNQLEEFASEMSFAKGEILFHEGDYADRFFLILGGKVELETSSNGKPSIVVQTLGPGEVLGWSWMFAPFEWHFTAKALEPTTVVVLNGASLLIRAEEDPRFGYELMKRISRQVIDRLQSTRKRFIHKLHQRDLHS